MAASATLAKTTGHFTFFFIMHLSLGMTFYQIKSYKTYEWTYLLQTSNKGLLQLHTGTLQTVWNKIKVFLYMINAQRLFDTINTQSILVKFLSVRWRTKWLWVRVPLLSLKLQISHLFQAKNVLTFRQLLNVDSLWDPYVTW